jgi:hypothetical protein
MLKSIDILIGVAVVMLVVSATVTALTQFVLHLMEAKGKQLKVGIADLLQLISPNFGRECAERIAEVVLKHPLVSLGDNKLSDTIHREELVKMLLELSTATGANTLADKDREALKSALDANGIKDPAAVLENARSLLLQLEMSRPDLSNAMRTDIVLLQEASSAFLAKIHSWFDQTIDRTKDRFTITARQVTFVCAAVVVVFLQLDTIALINQLSMDSQLRNTLVQQAMEIGAAPAPGVPAPSGPTGTTIPGTTASAASGATGSTTAGSTGSAIALPGASGASGPTAPATSGQNQDVPAAVNELRRDLDANSDQIKGLASLGLFRVPASIGEWEKGFSSGNVIMKILGLLISVVLLSMGAPFWYNALKTLIGLRSVVAGKDDQQRNQRQTQTTDAGASATAAAAAGAGSGAPAALRGER